MSKLCEQLEDQIKHDRKALQDKQTQLLESTEEIKEQLLLQREVKTEGSQIKVFNNFYCFLAASPKFDTKNGTCECIPSLSDI
jgi:hypothetical protein